MNARTIQSLLPPGEKVRMRGKWRTLMKTHKHRLTGIARELRANSTDAELLLWKHLRNRQLGGYKFRRQLPVGSAIADFLCIDAMLIVELDGGQHADQFAADSVRTARLEAAGYKVIRFWNDQVLTQTEEVLAEILRNLEGNSPHPNPLPEGEGEKHEDSF
mgnify:CR=1 FL=1